MPAGFKNSILYLLSLNKEDCLVGTPLAKVIQVIELCRGLN